jgi:predicted Zn-dependent protease
MDEPDPHTSNDPLDVLRLLGHMYLRYGRAEPALILLRALTLLAPHDQRAQRALVRAAIMAGQTEEALRTIDHLRDEADDSPVLWLLEGQALAALGRRTEALAVLERFSLQRQQRQQQLQEQRRQAESRPAKAPRKILQSPQ